jgi:hypothetical protein
MYELINLFNKVVDTVKPAVAVMWAVITYVLFPEQSFYGWCIGVWGGALLDLFTRWYAIFRKNGGIKNALLTKAWNSEAMFHKTSIKIVAYLVIMILAGFSMRYVSIPYISNAVATVVYAFMFFREFISNIENLIDAGADYLKPLLFWVKKKEAKVLEKNTETESDESERI